MSTNKKGIRLIAEICRRNGIRKVVFSPGSRSAPLVIAFSQMPQIECIVIPDERVAGYFALGLAQQLRETVGVVCTSGTAVLNLSPAVCEAYYQNIPLLILTADRPSGSVSRGENQAIMQEDIFGAHTVFQCSVNAEINESYEMENLFSKVSEAIYETKHSYIGPAHINIHISEPLYEMDNEPTAYEIDLREPNLSNEFIPLKDLQRIKRNFNRYDRKLIIVGVRECDEDFRGQLEKLNKRKDVLVINENLANLNIRDTVWNIDACLSNMNKNAEKDFIPEVVITLGRQIISKKLKQFLKDKPKIHWDIPPGSGSARSWAMLGDMLDSIEPVNEMQFLHAIIETNESTATDFKRDWLNLSKQANDVSKKYLAKTPYSDLKVMETLIKSFPDKANIQYGNSTPVRYSNIFLHKESLLCNSNRGTSGIDGCLSTAAGAAYIKNGITICVLGDVSFFYDSNALWNNYLSPGLRIIIINNGGGNIFRLIEGPNKVNNFEKFFETKHELTAKHLASMYGLPYYFCAFQKELEETLKTFYRPSTTAKILEIKTDGKLSAEVYKKYFEFLKTNS